MWWLILGLIAYFPLKALLNNIVLFDTNYNGRRTGEGEDLIPKWTILHTIFLGVVSICLGVISLLAVVVAIGILVFNPSVELREGTWLSKKSVI